jgi:ribosomal protein S18 acetylase RimI-like enzyme
MLNSLHTRALTRADLGSVAAILDATNLFPGELLPAMVEPFLTELSNHRWLVICDQETTLGFAYSEQERMTDNTHNLLAIAVTPEHQNRGVGKHLVNALKDALAKDGGRILIVETSSLDEYEGTRAFYLGQGFEREAVIRDFYAEGESKEVFWKKL